MFDAGALGIERRGAIGAVDGPVEGSVSFGESGGHRDGIVQIRQRRALFQMLCAFVQHRLRQALNLRTALIGDLFGPGEGVVNDAAGILISHFKSAGDLTHPGHVHGRGQNAEVVESGVGKNPEFVGDDSLWLHVSDRDIFAPFG